MYFSQYIYIALTTAISISPCSADSLDYLIANKPIIEKGMASWYGDGFHGKKTATGELFDMEGFTAAHRTLPFGTIVLVMNIVNGKSVLVRINDRGPFAKHRIIDLSKAAAAQLDMIGPGTAQVQLHLVQGKLTKGRIADLTTAHFTIQVASFQDGYLANQRSDDLPGSWVELVQVKGDAQFRVYYGYFSNLEDALEENKRLSTLGILGFVKQLEND